MYAVAFALLGAVLVGVGEFSAHFGLRHVRPLFGVFLGSCYQVLTLLVVAACGAPPPAPAQPPTAVELKTWPMLDRYLGEEHGGGYYKKK
ncbi:MAG: hypothetical protein QGH70_12400, partial [Nitrospinota bacterium]|nr:hypothetical protein [Nitrospinota bacterium]